jgi:hypothetical protein
MVRLLSGGGACGLKSIPGDQGPQIGKLRPHPSGQIDDTAGDGGTKARLPVREITEKAHAIYPRGQRRFGRLLVMHQRYGDDGRSACGHGFQYSDFEVWNTGFRVTISPSRA